MSDATKSSVADATAAPKFTDRELQILGWAMQSLKSGPPEIDVKKLAAFAGMTNPRSAGNAWAALKKKLMAPTDGTAPPPTPRKTGGRKKKDDGDAGEETPVKTPRKRANATKDAEDGDASPKKKGRAIKPKPKPKPEPEDDDSKVKAESADEDKPDVDVTQTEEEV